MASSLKPIQVHGKGGPNPPKVMIILKELDLPYEIMDTGFADIKKPEYLAVNPNGRLPAIYDPNTDLTLWESGAIVEYLVETYDKDNKISFPKGSNASYLTKQWLYFQTTGQGPYYGQAVWFTRNHPDKTAIERYVKEINRVTGVVESHLAAQKEKNSGGDGPWLVGNKITFADLAWYMWQVMVVRAIPDQIIDYTQYPNVKEWIDKLTARPSVDFALELVKKLN
ncbi:glutathione S-transferase [Nemania sp. FL0916]|nr:glutathione S-transferase [Nemania sp. FL0916]